MNRVRLPIWTFLVAATLAACGGDAARPTVEVPTPVAEPPSVEALLALETRAREARLRGDSSVFAGLSSERFVMRRGRERIDKAGALKRIASVRCDLTTWSLDDPWIARVDADTYVLSYRGTWDGTCTGADGVSIQIQSPTRAATIWVRGGDGWRAAFHGENPILDPDDSPGAAPARPTETVETMPAGPNTSALVAVERAVWEAWMAHDADALTRLTAEDLSFIDIFGNDYSNKTDTIEAWSGSICDVNAVDVADGVATALSPTVELLMHEGTAEGTCYGERVPAVHGNSVYVREGDAWRLAFTMNMLAM